MNVAAHPRHILSLFSGGAGLDLAIGTAVREARTVCFVEHEAYAVGVLVARMEEGALVAAPVWSDASTFDGRAWRGVDLVAGGTPCTDLSVAGQRAGITGERSGLWTQYVRIVRECEPAFIFWENVGAVTSAAGNADRDAGDGAPELDAAGNVPAADGDGADVEDTASESVRALGVVLADLSALGFHAEWATFRASETGAPHRRERLFVLGWHPERVGLADAASIQSGQQQSAGARLAGADGAGGVADSNVAQRDGGERVARTDVGECGTGSAGGNQRVADADSGPVRDESGRRDGSHGAEAPLAGHDGFQSRLVGNPHKPGLEGRRLRRRGGADERAAGASGGAELVHAEVERWREGRAEPATRDGLDCAASGAEPVADADGTGREPGTEGRIRRDVRGLSELAAGCGKLGRDAQLGFVPYPPGPDDADGWREYLARYPGLEPARAQSKVRRSVDELADQLDVRVRGGECTCSRIAQLRVLGNGVVVAQGALAFRELWWRAFGSEVA